MKSGRTHGYYRVLYIVFYYFVGNDNISLVCLTIINRPVNTRVIRN